MSHARINEDISLQKQTQYTIVNDTAYDVRTPAKVIDVLENARLLKRRVKIYLGDAETGRDWLEEFDTTGTIGRSTGNYKVPLLIKTVRSHGGSSILTHCILKIKDVASGRVLYQADNYKEPRIEKLNGLEPYPFLVKVNGIVHAQCLTEEGANLYIRRIS